MSSADKKAALITGASSGIGAVYTRALAKQGKRHLVLAARRVDRLNQVAEEVRAIWKASPSSASLRVEVIQCDLSERESRTRLCSQIDELGLEIDYLVNNAGFGTIGSFLNSDFDRQEAMVRLNCIAPLALIQHYLPQMTSSGKGVIINVASVAAYQPMPFMATYAATKAFLLSLSVALASEIKGTGVTVLAQCPGPTESEFFMVAGLSERMKYLPGMTAEQVVDEALAAAEKKRAIVVHGWLNWFGTILNSLLPKTISASLIGGFLKKYA